MGISAFINRVLGKAEAEERAPADAVAPAELVAPEESPQEIEPKYVSDYLPDELQERLFPADLQGVPPVRVKPRRGEAWLVDDVYGRLITPGNRRLTKLGVISLNLRGVEHYRKNHRSATLKPLGKLELVREPDNPHDKNAVAVCAPGTIAPLGYVNKALAGQLAKRLDAGEELAAVLLRKQPFSIVIATPEVMRHLL